MPLIPGPEFYAVFIEAEANPSLRAPTFVCGEGENGSGAINLLSSGTSATYAPYTTVGALKLRKPTNLMPIMLV